MRSKILIAGGAVMALVWACSHDFENPYDPGYNQVPEIRLEVTPEQPVVGHELTFNGENTIDPDGDELIFRLVRLQLGTTVNEVPLVDWNSNPVMRVTPSFPVMYRFRYEVKDAKGACVAIEHQVDVQVDTSGGTNTSPSAYFFMSSNPAQVNEEVIFNAYNSSDNEDDIGDLRFKWNFGDGIVSAWLDTFRVSHSFSNAGSLVVRLFVRDTDDAVDSMEKVLVVEEVDVTPFAYFTVAPKYGDINQGFTFDANGSHDQGIDSSGLEFRWEISLADFPDSILNVTQFNTSGAIFNQTFQTAGLKNILLQVRNVNGVVGSAFISLPVIRTAINDRPYAAFSVTPHRGTTNTDFAVDAGLCVDPESDALEVYWDWGENDRSVDWSATYTNATRYDTPGLKTIELQVRDGIGRVSVARLQVYVE